MQSIRSIGAAMVRRSAGLVTLQQQRRWQASDSGPSAEAAGANTPAPAPVDAVGSSEASAPPEVPLSCWQAVVPPAWQRRNVVDRRAARTAAMGGNNGATTGDTSTTNTTNTSDSLGPYFLFGNSLGPRPLLVLDAMVPAADAPDAVSPLRAYEPMLNALAHRHGAISLPMVAKRGAPSDEAALAAMSPAEKEALLSAVCDDIVTLLDTLDVRWPSAILCRSTGALVAARLAALYPERAGGLVLLDTPLVSQRWREAERVRAELQLAAADVNVPLSMLEFSVRGLVGPAEEGEGGLEAPEAVPLTEPSPSCAPAVVSFNRAVHEQALFPPALVFPTTLKGATAAVPPHVQASSLRFLSSLVDPAAAAADADFVASGVARSNATYLSVDALAAIRHPVLLLCPPAKALADGRLHQQTFNMRKPTIVSTAKDKDSAANSSGKESEKDKKNSSSTTKKEDGAPPAAAAKGPAASSPPPTSLFDTALVPAAAKAIGAFVSRFESDTVIARRVEQAAADLLAKVSGAASVGAAVAAKDDDGGKKGKKGKGKPPQPNKA